MAASNLLMEEVKMLAKNIHQQVIDIRRHIHQNPELSFYEKQTAEFISSKLKTWGIEHQTEIGGYGIVALIHGSSAGNKTICLRADMDALPIEEKNEVAYKSKNKGLMHACGHDVHSASLLGTAFILHELRDKFSGTIKLIFQPAEEKLPGGASIMIQENALKNPDVDIIIGQHVFPSMQVGKAGFRSGQYMASADEIYITIKGKGGHAAIPKEYRNPIMAAGKLLTEFEKLISELHQSATPIVFAIGKIMGNGATNVIPEIVTMDGTLRCMDEKMRKETWTKIENAVSKISSQLEGIQIELRIEKGYPVLVNDDAVTEASRTAAEKYLGKEQIETLDIRMAAEDFAFYSQLVPATFYRIGTGNSSKNISSPVHTSTFNIDEDALEISTGLMCWIALSQL